MTTHPAFHAESVLDAHRASSTPRFCPSCGAGQDELHALRQENAQLRAEMRSLKGPRRRTITGVPPSLPDREPWSGFADDSYGGAAPTGGPASWSQPARARRPSLPLEAPPMSSAYDVAAPNQGIDFGAVAKLDPKELDALPYGLVVLDAEGRVIHYNDTESRLAGLPKGRVLGRNFFQDIAPCTRLREFEGRFRELVKDPTRVRLQSFDFVFRFEHSEQQVSVLIVPAKVRGQYNLAMVRRSIAAR